MKENIIKLSHEIGIKMCLTLTAPCFHATVEKMQESTMHVDTSLVFSAMDHSFRFESFSKVGSSWWRWLCLSICEMSRGTCQVHLGLGSPLWRNMHGLQKTFIKSSNLVLLVDWDHRRRQISSVPVRPEQIYHTHFPINTSIYHHLKVTPSWKSYRRQMLQGKLLCWRFHNACRT